MEADGIKVSSGALHAFQFDATDAPDLFPPLVALAVHGKGRSSIKGLHRLKHKESDRGIALQQEFGKMGIELMLDGDYLHVQGGEVKAGNFDAHHDHRIAMACTVALLKTKELSSLSGADAVGKSYPNFFEDMKALGLPIY